jgi:hypothetical protein
MLCCHCGCNVCGNYKLDYIYHQLTIFLYVSKSMFPILVLHLGGVSTKGEHGDYSASLLYFLFRQKGGEIY